MDYNERDYDATAHGGITESIARQGAQSNQGLANEYGSGMESAKGLLTRDDNFSQNLNYGDKATSEAIRSRYMPKYNHFESALKLQNVQNAQTDRARNLAITSEAAAQEVELNKQKALMKHQIEQANKRAKGAAIGNVLGIVGGVIGGFYGGAGGAQAGYAAGQGVGNMAGEA